MHYTMTTEDLLNTLGSFSKADAGLFDMHALKKRLKKNNILVREGEVCTCVYFILEGSFIQFQNRDTEKAIIDLHLQNEWLFNQQSLTTQTPSDTTIQAFSDAEVVELSLFHLHQLIAKSQSFLQFGKILNQPHNRTFIFDNSLTPGQKYEYITRSKPQLAKVFPVKMIASYLKIAPETLSRIRASS